MAKIVVGMMTLFMASTLMLVCLRVAFGLSWFVSPGQALAMWFAVVIWITVLLMVAEALKD